MVARSLPHALSEPQQELLRYLEMMKALRAEMVRSTDHLFTYLGMEHFLLEHGRWYEPRPWSDEYREGAPRNCFANAMMFGDSEGLRYVEGVALSVIPVHHGWNADADGNLIDSTWQNSGLAYFGVEFSVGRADDAIWNGDATVLDDWQRRHPLYRQPWPGEDYSLVWKPSKGLRAWRRLR